MRRAGTQVWGGPEDGGAARHDGFLQDNPPCNSRPWLCLACRRESRKRWPGFPGPLELRARSREVCASLHVWVLKCGWCCRSLCWVTVCVRV